MSWILATQEMIEAHDFSAPFIGAIETGTRTDYGTIRDLEQARWLWKQWGTQGRLWILDLPPKPRVHPIDSTWSAPLPHSP